MSSFGKELIMNKNITVNDGLFIGAKNKTSRTTFEMLGADIAINIDGSQSGDPGIVNLNMAAKENKMKVRFEGLPIVETTNVPPIEDITNVNGLYVFKANSADKFGTVCMKLAQP